MKNNEARKTKLKILQQVYTACLADGYAPFDELNPYEPRGALMECARRTLEKRGDILKYIQDGKIEEKTENYDAQDPHKVLRRALRSAGFDLSDILDPTLASPPVEATAELETGPCEDIKSRYQAAQKEISKLQGQLGDERAKGKKLREDMKRMEGQVRLTDEIYREVAGQFSKDAATTAFPQPTGRSRKAETLMPTLLLSDFHLTEWSSAEETMNVNVNNMDVALARLKQLTRGVIEVCDDRQTQKTVYQGIVVNLAGDIISGDIHDELRKTNRTRTMKDGFGQVLSYPASSFDAAFEALEALVPVLDAFKERFGLFALNVVVGNHGRNGEKYTYKGHVHNSFDYLIGKLLEKHYAKDKKAVINVAESTDMIFDIYTSRFLLTHGDRMGVRGGDGIIGALGPIIRGNKKMRDHLSNYGVTYHYTLMGHWHQYQAHSNLVVNGSLCGPNAYSSDNRMGPEAPQQAFFMVHPVRGVFYHHPIVCDYLYRQPRLDPLLPAPLTQADIKHPFRPLLGHQGPTPTSAAAPR